MKDGPCIGFGEAAAPVLDCDSTLWIVSAWNDNGFVPRLKGAGSGPAFALGLRVSSEI